MEGWQQALPPWGLAESSRCPCRVTARRQQHATPGSSRGSREVAQSSAQAQPPPLPPPPASGISVCSFFCLTSLASTCSLPLPRSLAWGAQGCECYCRDIRWVVTSSGSGGCDTQLSLTFPRESLPGSRATLSKMGAPATCIYLNRSPR